MRALFFLMAVSCVLKAEVQVHGYTPEVKNRLENQNRNLVMRRAHFDEFNGVVRPFAEYEKVKYILVSESDQYESRSIKQLIASKIPQEVLFIVYTSSAAKAGEIRSRYLPYLQSYNQLKIIHTPGGGGFWARDSLPVPVYEEGGKLGLVDARYGHGHEPDKYIANAFGVELFKHGYSFEGGNFLADHQGRCFTRSGLPQNIMQNFYGCKEIFRPSYSGGIGHIDERLKFVSKDTAITDSANFRSELEELGYNVLTVPKTGGNYGTYVNSLQVNGMVFMPTYGQSSDYQAKAVYESAGLEVYTAYSYSVSEVTQGSIHCFTMAYPEVGYNNLLQALGAKEL